MLYHSVNTNKYIILKHENKKDKQIFRSQFRTHFKAIPANNQI